MERILQALFDFQRFADNERLAAVIRETESERCKPLSDDDLELVNAAGELPVPVCPNTAGDCPHV